MWVIEQKLEILELPKKYKNVNNSNDLLGFLIELNI